MTWGCSPPRSRISPDPCNCIPIKPKAGRAPPSGFCYTSGLSLSLSATAVSLPPAGSLATPKHPCQAPFAQIFCGLPAQNIPPLSAFHFSVFAVILRFSRNKPYIIMLIILFVYEKTRFRGVVPFKRASDFDHLHKKSGGFPHLSTGGIFCRRRRFLGVRLQKPLAAPPFAPPFAGAVPGRPAPPPGDFSLFNLYNFEPPFSFDKPKPAVYTTPRAVGEVLRRVTVRQIFAAFTRSCSSPAPRSRRRIPHLSAGHTPTPARCREERN